jgi:ribosomal protein S18 acetylase RimI-like enzyme
MHSAQESALDNPVWSSLATRHAHLAQCGAPGRPGEPRALRYPPDYSPLSATLGTAAEDIAALHRLPAPGDDVIALAAQVGLPPPNWRVEHRIHALQMIRRDPTPLPQAGIEITPLTAIDAVDMIALVELTRPGPFRRRTVELGAFVGIREHGRLLAMAGERLWIGDHREVSGVCTHPHAQGRGLAAALMSHVINRMLRNGQVPFLHVESDNARALALYERLGFVKRTDFSLVHATRTT